jgi:type I restriction enzyme M protein
MARPKKDSTDKAPKRPQNGATLGFEEKLWQTADKLRGHMDASEYKHVVLGLIFLKYISDAFEEIHAEIAKEKGADPEDRDEYISRNIFWVPKEARWEEFQTKAKLKEIKLPDGKKGDIGGLIDAGMIAIEKENPSLKGVLPKDYARPSLDKTRLGELIDIISGIGLGDKESRSKDIIGRVYEYFLGKFASAEGKSGGEFYTPQAVVRLLVEMLEPYRGRVYDPCCGSGGMFVQSEKFVEAHGGKIGDIAIYGQESNPNTWRLAKMNLAIRGIEANLGSHNGDTFHHNLHKDLKADYILANPPFNVSDWGGERLLDDPRWGDFTTPPKGNANFAWVLHMISHLSPSGIAGFVLANASLSATGVQAEIKKRLVERDYVDCIVMLPNKLFHNFQGAVCLWIVSRNKVSKSVRAHAGEVLFIDARQQFVKAGPKNNEMTSEHIQLIAKIYKSWRNAKSSDYKDVVGLCRGVPIKEIQDEEFSLVPARHVGISVQPPDHTATINNIKTTETEIENIVTEMRGLTNLLSKSLNYA